MNQTPNREAPLTGTSEGTVDGYLIREVAALLDLTPKTVSRWAARGDFPAAYKVPGPTGEQWMIPPADVASVAAERGLKVGLSGTSGAALEGRSGTAEVGLERLREAHLAHVAEVEHKAEMLEAAMVTKLESLRELHAAEMDQVTSNLDRVTAERDRHRSDVDHLRAELERMTAERAEADKQRAVAQALADERADHLAKAEHRAEDIEHRADELAAERDRVVGLLGWRGRRRYRQP